jgi:nucleotide-binding universal stress UspA family protein
VAFNVPLYQEELEASSKKSLQEVAAQRVPKGLHVYQIIAQGDAAYQIVRIAEEEKADLIVMATHGQTGWRRLIFGSVTAKVVRLATCPVLTIQAPHEESESK